jgi:hypothetical protein
MSMIVKNLVAPKAAAKLKVLFFKPEEILRIRCSFRCRYILANHCNEVGHNLFRYLSLI